MSTELPTDSSSAPASGSGKGHRASVLALFLRALVASIAAVVLSAALGLWLLDEGYAGASDTGAAAQAASTYAAYLRLIGWQLFGVGVTLAACLSPAVLGLLLLARSLPGTRHWSRSRVLLPLAAAGVALGGFFLSVAHWRPGLFLSLLAASVPLTWATRLGYALGLVVALGAAAGFALALLRSDLPRWQRGFVAGLAAVCVVAFPTFALLPGPTKVFSEGELSRHQAKGKSDEQRRAAQKKAASRPNVLLLAVDSLRPDMIDPEHTPHLARLVAESIYYPNTLVTQPRTGPSWAAMLTGRPPLENGVETMFPSRDDGRLAKQALPGHLAAVGYRTAVFSEYAGEFFARCSFGFSANAVPTVELRDIAGQMLMARMPALQAATALLYAQGTLGRWLVGSRLSNLVRGLPNFSSPNVLLEDMQNLAKIDGAGTPDASPFFWLVFYSQPHFPYTSSSRFYTKYHVSGSSPELAFGRDVANEKPLTKPEDVQQLRGLYRAALAETDEAIGRVLELVESTGEMDDTIVIVLSDHGEGLYECPKCVGHGDQLATMLTLRVPMAFRLPAKHFPKAKPTVVQDYVSQLDLYPTLIELLGEKRMAHLPGKRLLTAKGQAKKLSARTHYAETGEWLWPTAAVPEDRLRYPVITQMATLDRGRIVIADEYLPEIRAGKHRVAIRAPHKLVYEPGATGVRYHLYDIEKDPLEEHDLIESEPRVASRLREDLRRSMLRHPQVVEVAEYFLSRPDPPPPENW